MNTNSLRQQLLAAVWMNPNSRSTKLATIPHPPAKRSSVTKCLSRMVKDGQLVNKDGCFALHPSVNPANIFVEPVTTLVA